MMEEGQGTLRFDVALNVRLDFKEKGTLTGKMDSIDGSGRDIAVKSSSAAQVGDAVTLEMPIPVEMRTIRCEGEVTGCNQLNDVYEIEISIRDIDERSKDCLQGFCGFLTQYARLDTVDYLVQQGEKALDEASEAILEKPMSARLEVLMHELLSLKYHDALRSFEDALEIDGENEAALEGFCYSLAKAISHYEHAGLSRLAGTIKLKALPYCTPKALEVAERSTRITGYFMKILREMLS